MILLAKMRDSSHIVRVDKVFTGLRSKSEVKRFIQYLGNYSTYYTDASPTKSLHYMNPPKLIWFKSIAFFFDYQSQHHIETFTLGMHNFFKDFIPNLCLELVKLIQIHTYCIPQFA